jgi:hypothetical protein
MAMVHRAWLHANSYTHGIFNFPPRLLKSAKAWRAWDWTKTTEL